MRRWLQVGIVAVALVLAFVPVDPTFIEVWYAGAVYPAIQRLVTPISNMIPFALFDLLTLVTVAVIAGGLFAAVRRARVERRWAPIVRMAAHSVVLAAGLYLVFLSLWGFNYRRLPMTERLVIERDAPTSAAVTELGLQAVMQLNRLHGEAHSAGWQDAPSRDARLVDAFAIVQRDLSDAPLAIPGRLKSTLYGPYFRWTSVDGMVNPFGLEVMANPDLLAFERPFVAAHEWAHLAGYADESEANFVGWLTCLRGDASAQYSGWLYLYWQVSGELGREDRGRLWDALAPGPRRDVEAIVERLRRGQLPALRNASWFMYDQYLRANRVEEGIRSYGAVVTLILRARFEDGWRPIRRSSVSASP